MKAISDIIAVLLMLVITVGLVGVVWAYVSGIFTARVATSFSVLVTYNDTVTIANNGDTPIKEMTATLDGNPVETVFDLNQHLVAYWKLNEGSGSTSTDEIQNLDINLNGQWVSGKFGSAYKFVGSGWVGTNFGSAIGRGVTYVFWFKLPDTTDTHGTFFCTEDVSVATIEDNLGQKGYGDRGCGVSWIDASLNVNDGNWHMYAFSKGTTSVLCRDNTCVSLGDGTGNIPDIKRIVFNGGCGCGYGNFAQGVILDEVRIYDRALTQAEIKALYAAEGETILDPGQSITIKPITTTPLSRGRHLLRLCTPSMCQGIYLTIV